MFAPCFEISSMRVGLDFEISYSSSKSKKVFRYHHPMRAGFWSLVGRK
jgi:hypothetical protein